MTRPPSRSSSHPTARAERPILFSGPMVRAILAGRKTVTRRLVQRPNPNATGVERQVAAPSCIDLPPGTHFYRWLLRGGISAGFLCPYGQPGEHLWVRETFAPAYFDDGRPAFRADYDRARIGDVVPEPKWKPSIFMPRDLSRLVLEVESVRVERLQDIEGEDAVRECIELPRCGCETCARTSVMCPADAGAHVEEFAHIWDHLNFKRAPWSSNPWVWRVEFRPVDAGRAALDAERKGTR